MDLIIETALNSLIFIIIWFIVMSIYSVIRIYFIVKEINKTWTIKNIWFIEQIMYKYINEHIKNRHESTSKQAD